MTWRNVSWSEEAYEIGDPEERKAHFISFGATPSEAEELLHYNDQHFDVEPSICKHYPLPDESFISTWRSYESEIQYAGSICALFCRLPQLQFSIQHNLCYRAEYVAAVTRGEFIFPKGIATGLKLEKAELCRLAISQTPAGNIPVIFTSTRADFVSFVQAFTKKGEPEDIPHSMGAVFINGYNNFHRIHCLRDSFDATPNTREPWGKVFLKIKQLKDLYKDSFIILSSGPYSGIDASTLGFSEEEWNSVSLTIRLEHECTHYFTRRVFGYTRNNLTDELMADYCGIDKAIGAYREDWATRFLGIEDEMKYRAGGRLENYCSSYNLSLGAFCVFQHIVRSAIMNLKTFNERSACQREALTYRAATLFTIASFTLEELAAPEAAKLLCKKFFDYSMLLGRHQQAR